MRLIQVILVVASISALVLYLTYFRSVIRDRIIGLAFFVVAVLAIMVPDITSVIAHKVGVGRGTDLIFYIFASGSVFFFILLYSRLARLDARQTELVRYLAITNAKEPGDPGNSAHSAVSRSSQ